MNILQKLRNRAGKPKERILYAITKGTYLGLCVIFVNPKDYPKDGNYAAMAIGGKDMDGGMEPMEIPEKDITEGLDKGILDKIRKVPKELYDLCCLEYNLRTDPEFKKTYDETTDLIEQDSKAWAGGEYESTN